MIRVKSKVSVARRADPRITEGKGKETRKKNTAAPNWLIVAKKKNITTNPNNEIEPWWRSVER